MKVDWSVSDDAVTEKSDGGGKEEEEEEEENGKGEGQQALGHRRKHDAHERARTTGATALT